MSIFDKLFGKKECGCSCGTEVKEEPKVQETSCSCEGTNEVNKMEIRVLGPGCKNCHTLEKNTLEAVNELGLDVKLTHVTDFAEIATYGIMSTPGLWVDGKVVSYGKVLSKDEIKELLKKL